MITVAEITTAAQLAEYRLLWRSLHSRTPGGSFFQTRECLECQLRHADAEVELRTLVVSVAQRPVGIVPLVIRPVDSRLGRVRALAYPLTDVAACMGPVSGNPTATLMGALRHIADARGDWDMLDLRAVDESVDRGRTANAFRLAELPVARRQWSTAGIIDLAALDAGQQFQFRKRLQAAERELWRQGRWEHLQAAPAGLAAASMFEPLWTMLEPLFHNQTPKQREHLYDMALTAAHLDSLGVQLLRLNGRSVGCLLTVAGNDRVDILASAVSGPEVADVLMGRLLFDDFLSGKPRVVFHPRHLPLAMPWEPQLTTTGRYTRFRSVRPRAQLLRLATWLRPRTSSGSIMPMQDQAAPTGVLQYPPARRRAEQRP